MAIKKIRKKLKQSFKKFFDFMSRDFESELLDKLSLKMYESKMKKVRNCTFKKELNEEKCYRFCSASEFCDKAQKSYEKE